ncbi:hypothetical protein MKX03_022585 [Papaver bracteatum]|nr:hypothetical protein MKX03_022585 [Papaver bracteatum]
MKFICTLTSTQMVLAFILCLLLLGNSYYSVEAAGRINAVEVATTDIRADYTCTSVIDGRCRTDLDCINHCKPKGYSGGYCEPGMGIMGERKPFICCCLY